MHFEGHTHADGDGKAHGMGFAEGFSPSESRFLCPECSSPPFSSAPRPTPSDAIADSSFVDHARLEPDPSSAGLAADLLASDGLFEGLDDASFLPDLKDFDILNL